MPETQNIEYKSVWKDEYLKWICGFANAQGGTLYIGKDDNGNVVGVKNVKKLLEELPNKITTILGIVAPVNLHQTEQGDYIEIIVDAHPNPVNYKGEYHFRRYNDFVEKRMVNWVKKQGGDAVKEQGQMRFTLPHSNKECIITEYQYSGPNALKRKNIMSGSWNYAVNKFTDWVTSEHVNKVNDKINAELSNQSQQIVDFQNKIHQIDNEIAVNQQEIQKLNKVSEDSVMGVISNNKTGSRSNELKGLLAAIKGYDAIEAQPSAGSNSFYIILNRSKMIVSNEVNKV